MNAKEIKSVLDAHKLWLDSNGEQGTRAALRHADLRHADLRYADLSSADLGYADLRAANLSGADLRAVNLGEANLRGANLGGANLAWANLGGASLGGANLGGADLSGANIDYSAWPLWCGSARVGVDARIAAQLAAHFCALDCDDPEYLAARAAIMGFAKTSHRASELGLLEDGDEN